MLHPMTEILKQELSVPLEGVYAPHCFRAQGLRAHPNIPHGIRRAHGIASLFAAPKPHIYRGDTIVGSIRPLWVEVSPEESQAAAEVCNGFQIRGFHHNGDHYAPDYGTILTEGIPGMLTRIEASMEAHRNAPDRVEFLESCRIALLGLRDRLAAYAEAAEALAGAEGYHSETLCQIKKNCAALCTRAPVTFGEALQLVWMIHNGFVCEGRYAMALGRMDQFLYPFFAHDIEEGTLTEEEATALLENVFLKICERRAYLGGDDVVNIAVGGVKPDGSDATNRLSFCILRAVGNVNFPGPNLSARIAPTTPEDFLDECLQVIGTGLGYPALMNDEVNIAALSRYGYAAEDARNYSMVGCIENFITGMQPPWSDGRFDTPRFLEYVFNDGKGYFHPSAGLDTGSVGSIASMEILMERLETQLRAGVREYVEGFNRVNVLPEPEKFTSPFLSLFCKDCIGRGLDINMGGAVYPSVHGAALMGVGTLCDSLAAVEQVVFIDKSATMEELKSYVEAHKGSFYTTSYTSYRLVNEKLLTTYKIDECMSVQEVQSAILRFYVDTKFDSLYKIHIRDAQLDDPDEEQTKADVLTTVLVLQDLADGDTKAVFSQSDTDPFKKASFTICQNILSAARVELNKIRKNTAYWEDPADPKTVTLQK